MVVPANRANPPAAGTALIRAAILIQVLLSHAANRSASALDSIAAT
jgi:hypothetical protein